jgi:pyruvate, water dikinase
VDLLWLGQSGCDDVSLVGGKAANLSRLAAVHNVPPGFCLTTTAHARATSGGLSLGEPISGSRLLPELLHRLVEEAYHSLAARSGTPEPSVAVRSSAVDEDGQIASFAGQHETYLNIAGVDAVTSAIQRCWASLANERARDYRRLHGLTLDGARLAVLVQRLVTADVSAVVFSANPVTGSRDEIVINASWGLGESIVGGTVTPDTYVIRKDDQSISSRMIAEKRRMTVSVPGGTREVDVPRFMRGKPTLDDNRAVEMARLALQLETTMGWPVDVECAYDPNQLFLLQCRPITTLPSN